MRAAVYPPGRRVRRGERFRRANTTCKEQFYALRVEWTTCASAALRSYTTAELGASAFLGELYRDTSAILRGEKVARKTAAGAHDDSLLIKLDTTTEESPPAIKRPADKPVIDLSSDT